MCGMYQLAKDLAKELDADIKTKQDNLSGSFWKSYGTVITFLYPMHKYGKIAKENLSKWICYDMGVPPPTKKYFPNFFRRMYMKLFYKLNEKSKEGADEYWSLSERHPKPRWTEKSKYVVGYDFDYALYLGRKTDYKNFDWLSKTMEELNINLLSSDNWSDEKVHKYLSGAKLLVTASIWEGYGRPVMEAQTLGIPVVCFDVGTHKKNVKKGFVVENGNFDLLKEKIEEAWKIY